MKNLNVYNKMDSATLPDTLNNPDAFNTFFQNSAPNIPLSNEILHKYSHSSSKTKFTLRLRPVGSKEIIDSISLIKSNSSGEDTFTTHILKLFLPYSLPTIKHIINYSITKNVVPLSWKTAIVVPLPKKSNPEAYSDCRPISLLNVMSKILERVVQNQLLTHVNSNQLLPQNQSGFRKAHSTITTLLEVTDDILKSFDEAKVTTSVLLDYTKAFDSINHKLLIAKLRYFGVHDDSINWFHSYLTDRKQKVKLCGENGVVFSQYLNIKSGVPQGSILGPLLFAIYICDLPNIVKYTKIHYYADDSQMYISYHPDEMDVAMELLNIDLQNILSFSTSHCLQLNATKSVVINFHSKHVKFTPQRQDVKIGSQNLLVVKSSRNLGITFDQHLTFQNHITNIVKSSYAKLRQLYNFRYVLPTDTKIKLTESLIISTCEYGSVVFGSCITTSEAHRLQKIQNSCLRFATLTKRSQHVTPLYINNNILNMNQRWKYRLICLVHKILQNRMPLYLYKRLVFRGSLHQTQLRYVDRTLHTPRHRTEMYKSSFSFSAAFQYNNIPENIKSLSLRNFKLELCKFLFAQK
ncbi:hypothetical protein GJU03_01205 [Enterobacteriaceae endosymbiont of Donacia bicoloricornis]|uniref:RNA-directed DNA polymerase n=1 Tax=Enterobacteriaceae endosymbiont of Donacia bicoloricornis TaxID=2675772 RepID=UPI001449029A|nr:reverse transcriptase family protein [Enterobacteriaceae endosymbiont of Donacia bicoloricornis]QJC37765.1 hypothetical protein GJU03_01205 [Enterobacteriaceae endosymbiont of Donacia bicoloricornis]